MANICIINNTPKLHKYYWNYYSINKENDYLSKAETFNLIFVINIFTLYYSIDLLLGFYFITVYTLLTE